jgi:hypothetical protein
MLHNPQVVLVVQAWQLPLLVQVSLTLVVVLV